MARTTVTYVREIINTELTDAVIKTNFIATANIIVEERLAASDCAYSCILLAAIEGYLAAHFIALSTASGTLKFTKLGDASESYNTDMLGAGLNSTPYGQAALTLDSCGILASVTNPNLRARFRVV